MGSGPLLLLMHLGLNNGPFVLHVNLWEPCYFTNIPHGPQMHTWPGNMIVTEHIQLNSVCLTFLKLRTPW